VEKKLDQNKSDKKIREQTDRCHRPTEISLRNGREDLESPSLNKLADREMERATWWAELTRSI
jgi:hypothetical protein